MKCIAASLVVVALLPSSLSFFHAGSKLSKPKDDCHTVWEEVVTPRCKTTFEKVRGLGPFYFFKVLMGFFPCRLSLSLITLAPPPAMHHRGGGEVQDRLHHGVLGGEQGEVQECA